jgi:predicted transposase YbfD/YdcC
MVLITTLSASRMSPEVCIGWVMIENSLHWQLDVSFREDSNREQGRNAAANLALVRKLALILLKRHPSKQSIACKRLHAALSVDFLEEVVQQSANS